ncbi:hypothetical protein [Bosea sp. NBC_00550]|uniref:hypothetical protein n=1 Tax=Bosea sp. NBC_00550 TaxID=2969621 RepID=UPI002231954B|nr:hypothetical protein [Bosea sp. NBC_00550]UZF91537.1 hypothetical protein NWE53_20840 [Bosea sp. NBC_00550]
MTNIMATSQGAERRHLSGVWLVDMAGLKLCDVTRQAQNDEPSLKNDDDSDFIDLFSA